MGVIDSLLGAGRRLPGVFGDVVQDLSRAEDPRDDEVPGPAEVGETLRSIDSRLDPIHQEIRRVDESAGQLRAELETSRREIAALNETAKSLNDSMARLSGEIEHLLDRVPGLSPERARERAEEIGSE